MTAALSTDNDVDTLDLVGIEMELDKEVPPDCRPTKPPIRR